MVSIDPISRITFRKGLIMASDSGRKAKIPEQYHEEIYKLYAAGVQMPDIHKKIREEWVIDCSIKTVYTLVSHLRGIKLTYLSELMGADSNNTMARYKWLQQQLEEIAIACKGDLNIFLKVSDRLCHMYEFQLTFNQNTHQKQIDLSNVTDHGKDELLKELRSN
jgi:hypothetical protein